jgi:5-enolpyruvylshikimate-3-phosphate synthase
MSFLAIRKVSPFDARMVVPPSKYHTHRAFILASLVDGESRITRISESLGNMATVRCLSLSSALRMDIRYGEGLIRLPKMSLMWAIPVQPSTFFWP